MSCCTHPTIGVACLLIVVPGTMPARPFISRGALSTERFQSVVRYSFNGERGCGLAAKASTVPGTSNCQASRHRLPCRSVEGGSSMHARVSLILAAAMSLYGLAIAPAFALDAPTCTANAEQRVLAQAGSGNVSSTCTANGEPTVLADGKGDQGSCLRSCERSYNSCISSKGGNACSQRYQNCIQSCVGGKSG